MSFFDKFKREDEKGDDSGLSLPGLEPLSQPTAPATPPPVDYTNPDMNLQMGIPRPREQAEVDYQQRTQPAPSNTFQERDMQLILAKLDAIKSELDSLHQRVQKIERIAEADQAAAQKTTNYGRW